jgi:uncharacterized protein (DUF433 family)
MAANSGLYPVAKMEVQAVIWRPTYLVSDAARWADTTPQTARRWIAGYRHHGDRWSAPVTARRNAETFLSFEDLVEVAVVAAIRRAKVSMPRIRQAVDFAHRELGVDRPLVAYRFKTDGRELFIGDPAVRQGYTNLNRFGQIAMRTIEAVLRDVDYEAELAARWWPVGRDIPILIDPRVNFGRPIVADIGVRTETLYGRWAGGDTIASLAGEFGTTPDVVELALRFENRVPLAA